MLTKVTTRCPYPACRSLTESGGDWCDVCGWPTQRCACGTANRAFATYCRDCGRRLPESAEWRMYGADSMNSFSTPALARAGDAARVLWQRHDLGRVRAHPVAFRGLLVLSLESGSVVGLSGASGREMFRLVPPPDERVNSLLFARSTNPAIPGACDSRLFVSSNTRVYCCDLSRATDGGRFELEPVWTCPAGRQISHELKGTDEVICVCSSSARAEAARHRLDVFEASRPANQGVFELSARPGKPVLAKSQVIIGLDTGEVLKLDCQPNDLGLSTLVPWQTPVQEALSVRVPPVIRQNRVYAASESGSIYRASLHVADRFTQALTGREPTMTAFLVREDGLFVAYSLGVKVYGQSGALEFQDDTRGGHAAPVYYCVTAGDQVLGLSEEGTLSSYGRQGGRIVTTSIGGPWRSALGRQSEVTLPLIGDRGRAYLVSRTGLACALSFDVG